MDTHIKRDTHYTKENNDTEKKKLIQIIKREFEEKYILKTKEKKVV